MEMVPDATLDVLRLVIAAETGVEPENQSALTFKGARQDLLKDSTTTIEAAGVRPGTVIKMIGTSTVHQEASTFALSVVAATEPHFSTCRHLH